MPRKPKPKNTLSAGERVALYEAEQEEKRRTLSSASQVSHTAPDENVTTAVLDDKKPEGSEIKAKKSKPKPQSATVRVDFSIPTGSIKPMHGMCNGPVSYGADISDEFRQIGVPFVRFDCTDTAISEYAVDISRIFKNFDADPSDPENYDFAYTDRCVEAALLSGAQVIYRLGESRDLFGSAKTVECPENIDTLARVCVNIIRHYNDGWANGRHYEIKYFELWNCGDDSSADIELYGRLANAVKLYDESLRVGGMSFASFSHAREILRACKKNRIPLDFVTVDCFSGDPERVGEDAERFVSYAKELGFDTLELIVGKWAYVDADALGDASLPRTLASNGDIMREKRRKMFLSQRSVKGAAYSAALMLRLGEVDGMTATCYYDAQPAISPFCALTDKLGVAEKPFYAFRAFGELFRAKNSVLCAVDRPEAYAHNGIFASAALSDDGKGVVMIASFGGCGVVDLRLDGISENVYTADVYMLDGVKNMELADSVPVSGMKKRLVLNVSEYGVVVVKLY